MRSEMTCDDPLGVGMSPREFNHDVKDSRQQLTAKKQVRLDDDAAKVACCHAIEAVLQGRLGHRHETCLRSIDGRAFASQACEVEHPCGCVLITTPTSDHHERRVFGGHNRLIRDRLSESQ